MASKRVFIVFVLPVILSVILGSVVLSDVLEKPGRELNMWPMSYSEGVSISHSSPIEIIGLSKQYSTTEPVEIQVKVTDSSFSCGDLYITIYSSGTTNVILQEGFFEQCFESGSNTIPVGDEFSKVIDTPGSYDIVTEIVSKQLKNISTKGTFTIK
ncbi:hypothetical protein C5F49_07305 [Nitrosopumilus oxyclinae]|uniref:Uncharacterized protein n=1 Tax=Nitrosopumilus oxyclinae TaxID=1959104 RepID=A0A7D5M622_9ARCH|nr:hypothetical protein [Nitrosopumilus oxyclinae]QLH05148.1 hypothetical protein C5F49_07305 [Nitrosopumilus oxyclinae]